MLEFSQTVIELRHSLLCNYITYYQFILRSVSNILRIRNPLGVMDLDLFLGSGSHNHNDSGQFHFIKHQPDDVTEVTLFFFHCRKCCIEETLYLN